ncbi:Sip1-related alpha-galactosidase [Fictibacillus terranigra]|uniref:Sip1-related alpha-galactosidase n=1 Tax=Fictibacillus terranigra TaxID=3058424 RepID=A0ABT8E517_9BACL|nr:Sip1-related alpha-galactosidase [Fictibacillus sp. CENA-BCM004]MDN4073000.1 Sip1-related alpha-galactosidase [Fictibacillus sp. CENA-BCM004]
MFQFQFKQDQFQCFSNGEALMSGIQVSINVDSERDQRLPFTKMEEVTGEDHLGEFHEYHCFFNEETLAVQAVLRFRAYPSFVLAFVDATIENEQTFKKQTYFSAKDAIKITMEEWPEKYKLMANYQHKDWWTRPYFGTDIRKLPDRTQSLLLKSAQRYYHMLPVCDDVCRTDLQGAEQGLKVIVSPFQGGFDRIHAFAFILGTGDDPFKLAEDLAVTALTVCGQHALPRLQKKYPEILDYLGWCSWDAFYHGVNEKGILTKAEELQHQGVPVKWMMIDDGWSEVSNNRLQAFHADKQKFPNGLRNAVRALKEDYNVKWVGVWHTIAGYWEGIAPNSQLADSFNQYLYKTKNGSLIPSPNAEEGFGFWNAWHSQLRQEGIDFVKVDSQSAINNFMANHQPVGEAARGVHTALEASTSLYFGNCVINCMGMAQENIWHRPQSAISRNSDDFVPQEKGSFREHALQNVYNSIYHGAFYWGDWDMYWTNNHDDMQNIVLRAVSGGPIYFSDPVNETNPEKIWPLIYKNGRIIRCEQPGLPTEDSLFVDPMKTPHLLKIWNRSKGAGVIAAFNIYEGNKTVVGDISPMDVPGLQGDSFLVYDVIGKNVWKVNKDERIHIESAINDVSLFIIVPIQYTVVPIGLINKLITYDGIQQIWKSEQGIKLTVKEGGVLAFYSEHEPVKAVVNGRPVSIQQASVYDSLYTIDCNDVSGEVLVEVEVRSKS